MVGKKGQENLETILLDYLGAIREGNKDALRALLDPRITWRGLREAWVCHGPDEVIDTLQQGLELRRDVTGLEFIRAGNRVVMGVRGPAIDRIEDEELGGQIFNVFTLRKGRIVRIEDYKLRAEALEAAEAATDSGWR